jgi:hypothetical protein
LAFSVNEFDADLSRDDGLCLDKLGTRVQMICLLSLSRWCL